jgi:hypothetical protein
LLNQASASRAEHGTYIQFLLPRSAARKDKIGDVGAGDQQNARDSSQEQQQRRPYIADLGLLEIHDSSADGLIRSPYDGD